jgi:hypothetical protein
LAIAAKTSALSRFVGKSVLKDLRFELQFDDPRQPDDNRVTIRGDQTELDMLYEAVNSYVQNFLGSSSTQLPLTTGTLATPTGSTPHERSSWDSFALPASGITHPDAIASPSLNHEAGKFDDSTSVPPQELNAKVRSAVGGSAGLRPASLALSLHPRSLATDIYLEPKGLLAHNLVLGHLANEESGPAINLSVTQLFDLATALDEYAAEAVALPNNNALSWKKAPAWAYTAAAVVVAVGVTATTMNVLNRPKPYQTATTQTANQPASPSTSPTTPVTPTPAASISLLPTPTVPSPLSTAPKLPPPSPVKIPTAPAPLNVPIGNQPPTNSSIGSERPSTTIRLDPAEPVTAPPQRSSTTVVPGAVASSSGSSPTRSSPTRSNTSPTASSPTVSLSGSAKRSPAPASPEKAPPQQAAARPTKPSDVAIAPPLPDLPSLKPTTTSPPNLSVDQPISSAEIRTSSPLADANESQSAPDNTQGRTSLFDTIPQVKEVRDYLQDRWKPASEMTQILEYYVLLNSDGKVDRIIPINKAAEENLNRTNIPRPGEPFVSPVEGEGNPKIRVVFSPDGKVETFYEGREGRN